MRHLAACLLAGINNDSIPSADKIKDILGSVGVEADEKHLSVLLEKMKGQSPAALIKNGTALLVSMPTAGASVAAPAAGGGAAAASAGGKAAPKEEKKEEKKEEPEEESDDDMGFGLFD